VIAVQELLIPCGLTMKEQKKTGLLISIDQEQLFTYEVEELEVQE
jgi:hypothetical protein